MTVFDIKEKLLRCVKLSDEAAVDTETGEVIDVEAIKNLEMEFDEKVKNVAMWCKQLDYEYTALDDHEKDVKARKNAVKNKRESLKRLLVEILGEGGKRKFPEISCTISKGRETVIYNGDRMAQLELPQKYQNWRFEGIKKAEMLNDLKAGVEIPGARIGYNPFPLIK